MRLSLSSAADPGASFPDLVGAAVRRGLSAIELVTGDAHGIGAESGDLELAALRRAVREAGVDVCGIRRSDPTADLARLARIAAGLRAPVIVAAEELDDAAIADATRVFTRAGTRLLLAHSTNAARIGAIRSRIDEAPGAGAMGIAWEVRPAHDEPAEMRAALEAAGPHLHYIRLHGGGPEAALQSGRGVGALIARLTLARYAGPLVLTPSEPRFHNVWRAWLGRVGGWGCGSKQSDASLVTLDTEDRTAEAIQ